MGTKKANESNTYVYKIADSLTMPKYQEEITAEENGYKSWDGKAEIEAEDNENIIVVELDITGKAVAAGKAIIKVKA